MLLLLVSAGPAYAQRITPEDVDAPWARLRLEETQTGILANRRAVLLDPTRYTGGTGSDTLGTLDWETLYGQLRQSAANPAMMPDPAALADRVRAHLANGHLPIAVLYQPFDYVDEADFTSGRLEVDYASAVEQAYRPTYSSVQGVSYAMTSPYNTAAVFAAGALHGPQTLRAVLGSAVVGVPLTLVVPADLFVVPSWTSRPPTVDVDMGDGRGFRNVGVGLPFQVTYSSAGWKTVRVRANVAGAIHEAKFNLLVQRNAPEESPPGLFFSTRAGQCMSDSYGNGGADFFRGADGVRRVYCDVDPGPSYAWSARRNYAGVLDEYDGVHRAAKYDYAVRLAPSNTTGRVRNPVVLVSGYDPMEATGLHEIYQTIVQYDPDSPLVRLDAALEEQGYDIVVMDYADSHDFIQRNGLALVHLLRRLHTEMGAEGQIAAVIGFSTGGLVTRYALNHMERTLNVDHRVRLFVSYDSPQQGAVVPMGLEMLAADVYSVLGGVLGATAFIGMGGDRADFIQRRLFGAAPQQLSTFWVGGALGARSPEAVQTQVRQDLYADFLAQGDYPARVRRVAVSNGSGAGLTQHRGADWRQGGAALTPSAPVFDVRAGAYGLWGLSRMQLSMETFNAPAPGQGERVVYQRKERNCFAFCSGWRVKASGSTSARNAYDGAPGGFRATYSQLRGLGLRKSTLTSPGGAIVGIFTGASAALEVMRVDAERHAFVPTLSALDWDATGTTAASRQALVTSTFLNQTLGAPVNRAERAQRTPFDAVLTADEGGAYTSGVGGQNQPHLFVSPGIRAFVLALPAPDRGAPPAAAPLAVSTSGPETVWYAYGATGRYGAHATGGTGTYTYAWSWREGSWQPWNETGWTGWEYHHWFDYGGDFQIRVAVTSGSAAVERVIAVHVGCPPGETCMLAGGPPVEGEAEGAGPAAESAAAPAPSGLALTVSTAEAPVPFGLGVPAPNPSRGAVRIAFGLDAEADVDLVVYDALGRAVVRLASGPHRAGRHEAVISRGGLRSGVYLVRLTAGAQTATRTFTFID